MNRCNAAVLTCCMLGQHGHCVLHTHRAKLSRLMRLLRHLKLKTAATPVPQASARVSVLGRLFDRRFAG